MNGAPRMAPTPTSFEWSPVANRIAMIGIIVSGSAVPTAASTDPTAPSARSSLRPNHSMLFVKSSAPSRMMKKAPISRTMSTRGQCSSASDVAMPTAITSRMPAPTATMRHCPSRANPTAETATRTIGVAMTAIRPSHRNPTGRPACRSGQMAWMSNVGAPSSGEIPLTQHQDDADDQEAHRHVGHDDHQAPDPGVEAVAASSDRLQQHLERRVDQDDDEQRPAGSAGRSGGRSGNRGWRPGRRRWRSVRRRTDRSRRGTGR